MSSILSSPELSFVAVVLFTNSSNSISTEESEKKSKKKCWLVGSQEEMGEKTELAEVGHTRVREGNKRYQPTSRIYMLSTQETPPEEELGDHSGILPGETHGQKSTAFSP